MGHRPFDKIDPYRTRRLRTELDKLQALSAQLQGKVGVSLRLQAQALGPDCQSRLIDRFKGLQGDYGAMPLVAHR